MVKVTGKRQKQILEVLQKHRHLWLTTNQIQKRIPNAYGNRVNQVIRTLRHKKKVNWKRAYAPLKNNTRKIMFIYRHKPENDRFNYE